MACGSFRTVSSLHRTVMPLVYACRRSDRFACVHACFKAVIPSTCIRTDHGQCDHADKRSDLRVSLRRCGNVWHCVVRRSSFLSMPECEQPTLPCRWRNNWLVCKPVTVRLMTEASLTIETLSTALLPLHQQPCIHVESLTTSVYGTCQCHVSEPELGV